METQEIEKKLKAIIADKFGVAEADITSESSYTGDLGADSLDFVELIMEVKNVFGIKVADTDASSINTVGETVALIAERINK